MDYSSSKFDSTYSILERKKAVVRFTYFFNLPFSSSNSRTRSITSLYSFFNILIVFSCSISLARYISSFSSLSDNYFLSLSISFLSGSPINSDFEGLLAILSRLEKSMAGLNIGIWGGYADAVCLRTTGGVSNGDNSKMFG